MSCDLDLQRVCAEFNITDDAVVSYITEMFSRESSMSSADARESSMSSADARAAVKVWV